MSNRVYLNSDGIIEIEVVGDQNVASVELMGREVDTLLTERRALGKPSLVLDNLLQMKQVDSDARKLVVELGKRLDYDRLAMLGTSGILQFGANLMLRATGRSYKMRYFVDRAEAIEWLKSAPASDKPSKMPGA